MMRSWLRPLLAALILASPSTATAQPGDEAEQERPAPATLGTSLAAQLSPSVARHLLRSQQPEDRIRGVRRLSGQGDYASVQILLQAAEDEPVLVSEPRVRLEVVRALAPFASRDPVRRLLVAWAGDAATRGRTAGPIGELARDQAAMALAASSNTRAVEQLVLMIADGGPAGERAAHALEAHPPRSIEPLLQESSLKSANVVGVLGRIGDLRAIPKLRKVLTAGDVDTKLAAAVALARLGDAAGVAAARDWIKQEGSTVALRIGAAQTLALTRDPYAPRAIAVLLADSTSRDAGLTLAERSPTPQLAPTLAGLLTITKDRERTRVMSALARSGGPLAVRTLTALVQHNPPDPDAAYALAHIRDATANQAIAQLFQNPSSRRIGARAALVRFIELGLSVDGLDDVIEALTQSKDPADRSVGVFGSVVLGLDSVEDHVGSPDEVVVLAACRGAMIGSSEALESCVARLTADANPILRDGLAGTLLVSRVTAASTATLLQWAESPSVAAPIFGRAVGPRDTETYRKRIEQLLRSGDPAMRSQVAMGLGSSPDASAASLLTDAYAFESDPWVRRAIIMGLAARRSGVGRPWLQRAATLDPDDQVRTTARQAIHQGRLPSPTRSDHVLWLRLTGTSKDTPVGGRPVQVMLSNGYATIVVTAPDGEVLVPGVTPGEVAIRVASAAPSQQSSRP